MVEAWTVLSELPLLSDSFCSFISCRLSDVSVLQRDRLGVVTPQSTDEVSCSVVYKLCIWYVLQLLLLDKLPNPEMRHVVTEKIVIQPLCTEQLSAA